MGGYSESGNVATFARLWSGRKGIFIVWVFTRYGFIAVVAARKKPDRTSDVDRSRVVLRWRVEAHVANFVKRFQTLVPYKVHADFSGLRDYRYIMVVPAEVWSQIAQELASEVDYPKFKPAVLEHEGGDIYHGYCLEVWDTMLVAQEQEHTDKKKQRRENLTIERRNDGEEYVSDWEIEPPWGGKFSGF